MKKRIYCAMLAVMMILAVFTGCSEEETIIQGSVYEENGDVIKGETVKSTSSNVTVDKTKKATSVSDTKYNYDITEVAMPKRELKNKTITVYNWSDLSTDSDETNVLMQKEFGVRFKTVLGQHATYWDTLSTLVASGKSPDLVYIPNWNFYPTPMSKNLIQPLDGIIDLEAQLWEDVYAYNQTLTFKGKHYITLSSVAQSTSLLYNTKMFKNFGVSKTPKDYFLEDNWTLETFKEVADKFVSLNKDGTNKTGGVAFQMCNPTVITGVELCTNDGSSYTLNLKDQKITTVMNMLYSMSRSGSKSLLACNDSVASFGNGEVAMLATKAYVLTSEDSRLKKIQNDIEWVPLPKMDKKSKYYMEMDMNAEPAIATGAKNVEGAALFIEYNHWKNLGWSPYAYTKRPENAATKKYKMTFVDGTKTLTSEQAAWSKTVYEKYNYEIGTNLWSSYAYLTEKAAVFPGLNSVINGKAWSAVVEQIYPTLNAAIGSVMK